LIISFKTIIVQHKKTGRETEGENSTKFEQIQQAIFAVVCGSCLPLHMTNE